MINSQPLRSCVEVSSLDMDDGCIRHHTSLITILVMGNLGRGCEMSSLLFDVRACWTQDGEQEEKSSNHPKSRLEGRGNECLFTAANILKAVRALCTYVRSSESRRQIKFEA